MWLILFEIMNMKLSSAAFHLSATSTNAIAAGLSEHGRSEGPAAEEGSSICFLYQLRGGPCPSSYGLEVRPSR